MLDLVMNLKAAKTTVILDRNSTETNFFFLLWSFFSDFAKSEKTEEVSKMNLAATAYFAVSTAMKTDTLHFFECALPYRL